VEDYDGELGSGLFLPDDAATNPARRALTMADTLRVRASLHEYTRACSVDSTRVTTDRGVIGAGLVIVALDSRLETLVPQLASRVRTARL
jgi:glycine/D-amino acid oxidase-like deaminating enzyme